MKRPLLILLIACLVPVALVACFYGYENWTGFQEWRKVRGSLVAGGEPLGFDALPPGTLAMEDNMAFAPVFRDLFLLRDPSDAPVSSLRLPQRGDAPQESRQIILLAHRFQKNFSGDTSEAARVVLEGMEPWEPILAAVASAAHRPGVVWPIDYAGATEVSVPILPALLRTSEVLTARGTAALTVGDTASAIADLELITRLAGSSNQPAIMSGCVTGARILDQAVGMVEQGLLHDAWTAEDLLRIDALFAACRPLDAFRESLRGERALFLEFPVERIERTAPIFTIIDFRSKLAEHVTRGICRLAWTMRPSGWLARDQAAYAKFSQEWMTFVIHRDFVRPWALADWSARLRDMRRDPLRFFRTPVTAITLPTFASAARASAYAQARIDLARIACAIERYRRQTGRLPSDLAVLTPAILDRVPHDVIGGGKYTYRPTGHAYVLYGRGWNGRDDGGITGTINPILGMPAAKDWVWETGSMLSANSGPLTPGP